MYNSPQLCTLHDLRTKYCLDDFYNFLEIIDATEALKEQARLDEEIKRKNTK
jgi:hypothetical protein